MKLLIGLLLLALSFENLAHAQLGIKEGGSGLRVEAAFRIRARELIAAVAKNPEAEALCSASSMKEALTSEIRVVTEIVDPRGQCQLGNEGDACSYPGDIQLKRDSWEGFLSHTQNRTGSRGTDAMILHEVYRATKDCNDEKFAITEKVYLLVDSAPTALAPPKFTWSSCFVTAQKRDKKGKVKTEESNTEDTYAHWLDGETTYSLGAREYDVAPGVKVGFVDQVMTVSTRKPAEKRIDFFAVGKYFDVSENGTVKIELFDRKYEAIGDKIHFEVKDKTHADDSQNLGRVVHKINPGPAGHQTKIEEQVEPDPVGKDGVQRISHKVICSTKTIEEKDVDYSGVFRVEPKIKLFSKAHERAMLAKDNWQTCQEKTPNADCSLQKSAFDMADKDRTALWTKLIEKSDLGEPKSAGKGGRGSKTVRGSKPGGNPMRCGTAAMNAWINACEFSRPNCSELAPGGYCNGIAGVVSRCLGRRPNVRMCGGFGSGF